MSIAKWEAIWKIPFMETENMTADQFISYCRCMTINKQKDPNVFDYIRKADAAKIIRYMNDSMSAWELKGNGRDDKKGPKRPMCAEFFYWLMIQYNIPQEYEKWHFRRLIALLDFCQDSAGDKKHEPEKKVNFNDRMRHYVELNAKRCRELGTKG